MANLPDLNPAEIGIIAFWNALDHWKGTGVQSIDPTDCIGVFSSYDVYDNGIEGYIDPKAKGWGGTGRHINVRVKSDGWMVAWIDRTNTFSYPNKPIDEFGENAHKGYYDILYDWLKYDSNISSTQTTLSYLISKLYGALSNKADFDYSDEDVGHYCYEYPDANVMTLLSLHTRQYHKVGHIQYTTETTIYEAQIAASAKGHSLYDAKCYFDTNELIYIHHQSTYKYASADILGWMPLPLTDYKLDVLSNGDIPHVHGSILILWS